MERLAKIIPNKNYTKDCKLVAVHLQIQNTVLIFFQAGLSMAFGNIEHTRQSN